jgi:hypothetical protein
MHATNTFPVDRHPQYRHYPTTIRSIVSGIIIEVRKKYTSIYIYIYTFQNHIHIYKHLSLSPTKH